MMSKVEGIVETTYKQKLKSEKEWNERKEKASKDKADKIQREMKILHLRSREERFMERRLESVLDLKEVLLKLGLAGLNRLLIPKQRQGKEIDE